MLTLSQEMRRRTWALLRTSDIFFSHQVSLPSMIYDHDCDTQLPNNIFDEEFGPDTKILPPSRPDSEPTPISYMIAKVKLCLVLGNILQATNRVGKQVPYDDILRFDARLRELKQELPPHLKMQKLGNAQDPLTLIVARFNVDILYLKIMCLLHRKYLNRSRDNPRYAHSRRSAIESALEMLHHLRVLDAESRPNGQLSSIKWFVCSISAKEFLLPAMLVLLDLHFDTQAEQSGARQNSQSMYFWTPEQRLEMIRAIEAAQNIWERLADSSMEAVKANNVTRIMLEKIRKPSDGSADKPMFAGMDDAELPPEQSAAMTLGMMSSGGLTPNTAAAFSNTIQSPGGTTYPAIDPGLSMGGVGERTGMTPDFSGDLGMAPNSPFSSMFGNGMGVGQNFDWVCWCDPPRGRKKTANRSSSRTRYRVIRRTLRGEPTGNFRPFLHSPAIKEAAIRRRAVASIHLAPRAARVSKSARRMCTLIRYPSLGPKYTTYTTGRYAGGPPASSAIVRWEPFIPFPAGNILFHVNAYVVIGVRLPLPPHSFCARFDRPPRARVAAS